MAERRSNDDRERRESAQQHESSRSGSSKGSERGGSSDLKQREYRDKEGDVHHHTHEYMERHGGKQGGSGSKRS